MSVWANKRIKKSLRVWCYEVMTSLRAEMKTELRCNVCNDVTVKEKCDEWHRAERYSLIIILDSALFWMMSFWQINYAAEMMFCDISDMKMIIEQAFSIKSVNNGLSAA